MADLRELKTTDIPDAIRADVEVLRNLCAYNDPAWRSLCNVMRALAAQPAPTGEVPMPEPDIEGSVMHPELKICYRAPVHYSADKLRAYGDARAAAEVAKVPEGWVWAMQDLLTQFEQRGYSSDPEHPDHIAVTQARALLAAAPQPAAVKQDLTTAQGEQTCGGDITRCVEHSGACLVCNPAPQPEAKGCACGQPNCVTPWEPGCGLGNSAGHVVAMPEPEAKAGADAPIRCAYCGDTGFVGDGIVRMECFRCSPAERAAQPKPAEGAVIAMSRMKDAAIEAHRLCYQAMLAHPEIDTLGDDGELHKAIHAIVGIDTPQYVAAEGEAVDLLQTVAVELEARARADERATPGDGDGPATLREWARRLRLIAPAGSGEAVAYIGGCFLQKIREGEECVDAILWSDPEHHGSGCHSAHPTAADCPDAMGRAKFAADMQRRREMSSNLPQPENPA